MTARAHIWEEKESRASVLDKSLVLEGPPPSSVERYWKKFNLMNKELPSVHVLPVQEPKRLLQKHQYSWVFNTQTQYKLTHDYLEIKLLPPKSLWNSKFKRLTKKKKDGLKVGEAPWNALPE